MKKKINSKSIDYLEEKGIDIDALCGGTTLKVQEKIVELIKISYEIIETFPKCEEWILKNQLRGAVQSILANVVEGNNQLYQKKQIQFFSIALGSLAETESHYIIANTLKYINGDKYNEIITLINEIKRLIVTYINTIFDEEKTRCTS